MKRTIAICLIALLIVPMAFAAKPNELDPSKDSKLAVLSRYEMPLTPRAKAMGGAGIAMPGRADSFFMNPAGFAKRSGVLLPSVDVTLYHPYDMLKSEGGNPSFIDSVLDATSENPDAIVAALPKLLGMIKNGEGKLLDVNAAVGFNFGGYFAFGLNVNDSVHTFGKGGGNVDSVLFDELNVTANVGIGLRFKFGDKVWMDIGANWRPTYRAYSTAIGVDQVQKLFGSSENGETAWILPHSSLRSFRLQPVLHIHSMSASTSATHGSVSVS